MDGKVGVGMDGKVGVGMDGKVGEEWMVRWERNGW